MSLFGGSVGYFISSDSDSLSSILGRLQSPGLGSVPVDSIVRQPGLDPGTDQGLLPISTQYLHPVLSPAKIVIVNPSVRLECCGAAMDQSAKKVYKLSRS